MKAKRENTEKGAKKAVSLPSVHNYSRQRLSNILPFMPECLQNAINKLPTNVLSQLSEIRLRRDAPVVLVRGNRSLFVTSTGKLYPVPEKDCLYLTSAQLDDVFMAMCGYTLHNVMHTLKEGYLTLPCGARVGVGVRAVYDHDTLSSAGDVSSLNIRIPFEAVGCSLPLLRALYRKALPSILVAGAPNSGKTTLLRDMARQLSSGFNGCCRKVTLVDERGELAGEQRCSGGINCDVLTGFSKAKGFEIAVRTLSPELIIGDEIATEQEVNAVRAAFASGVRVALSVHAADEAELLRKPVVKALLASGEFGYIVLLRGYRYQYEVLEVIDEADGSGAVDRLRNADGYSAGTAPTAEASDLP